MEKIISWGVVRNIANSLTNQLYLAVEGGSEIDLELAHISKWVGGPERAIEFEAKGNPCWQLSVGEDNKGWWEVAEKDVRMISWTSWTSGNKLEATKIEEGKWSLRYIPSEENPSYRGLYYGIWEDPDSVENLKEDYVFQTA